MRGHSAVEFTITDANRQTARYVMPKAKIWFTALACHMNWAAANSYSISHGVTLPKPQELANGYLMRFAGSLFPEWGDMVRGYRWPVGAFDVANNHDATIAEYWTDQASQAGNHSTAAITLGYPHVRPSGWRLCSVAVSRSP